MTEQADVGVRASVDDAPQALQDDEPPQRVRFDVVCLDDAWWRLLAMSESEVAGRFDVVGRAVAAHLTNGLERTRAPAGIASLAFSTDRQAAELNAAYRDKQGPTNVLSFPSDQIDPETGERYLGDIVLARETVSREAEAAGIDVLHHVTHLVVHGLLHLLGFDHETDEEVGEMECYEIAVLGDLGIENPYEEEGDAPSDRIR